MSIDPSGRRGGRTPGAGSRDRPHAQRPRHRRFAVLFTAVVGVLALFGAGGAVASLAQGPRLSEVQVDPRAAIESAGSRVILNANQALAGVSEEQVSVSPDVPFTIDASGRGIGVRFTVPLDEDTEYAVTVADVRSVGGGPASELTTTFRTPPAELLLLQRSPSGDDAVFRSDLSGENAVPVFTHPDIDDFRATTNHLVVSVREDGVSRLLVTDREGQNPVDLALPGEGFVTGLQVSDRGGLVGYTYSDRELSEDSGRASVLFTASLRDPRADPVPVEVGGSEPGIDRWRFVPETSALLFVDFSGELMLLDRSEGAEPSPLGNAITIDAVTRGTYTAIVERPDGIVELDLTSGEESPLVEPDADLGRLGSVLPIAERGSLRHYTRLGADGMPEAQLIAHVSREGAAKSLVEVGPGDAVLQACASPSGKYAAVLVAPDRVDNPYDSAHQPLPETLETHIVEVESAREVSVLTGFDISWCEVGPW